MIKQSNKQRLGDLLIERNAITQEQLTLAIEEQSRLRQLAETTGQPVQGAIAIGEILCEMGFINHKILKKTLNRQRRLRQAAMILALMAPLLSPLHAFAAKDKISSDDTASHQSYDSKIWQGEGKRPGSDIKKEKSVKLSWNIPEKDQYGRQLEIYDIDGYEVLYKKEGDMLFNSVIIDDAQATDYRLKNLEPGKYEIMLASFGGDDHYSTYSTMKVTVK